MEGYVNKNNIRDGRAMETQRKTEGRSERVKRRNEGSERRENENHSALTVPHLCTHTHAHFHAHTHT